MADSSDKKTVAERAVDVSDEVLQSLEERQRASVEAVRKFASTLDEVIPEFGDPSRRKTVIDAALDLADNLGTTQYEFLRSVVRNASDAIGKQGNAKN